MTLLDGRYELGRRIGGGGMAEVFQAYDRKLDRPVAVKLLRDVSDDPRAHERFAREARMVAGLVHPNVVTVFDVGETGGRPFLVMELVEGRTLAELLAEQGALATDQALRIEDSILAGLAAAHAQGLVHRDVKPANVLLANDGRVKLADFGIAKATRDLAGDLTAAGQVFGTPKYLSPEQTGGAAATPRSDVYAAGVVLYEMLAGVPPFVADDPVAIAVAHQRSAVPPLEATRSELNPWVMGLVARALEKDPNARYADASEMRAALRQGRGRADGTDPTVGAGIAGDATVDETPRTLPAPPVPPVPPVPVEGVGDGGRHGRRGIVTAAVAGAAVGSLVLAALLLSEAGTSGSRPQAVLSTTTTLPPSTTTTVSTTTTTLPTTLDGLIALLAADPSAYGEKGPELFDQLLSLRDHPDRNGKRAERLAHQIDQWVQDGQLDPTIGALVAQIVTSQANGGGD